MPEPRQVPIATLLRAVLSLAAFNLLLGIILFLAAGDIRWVDAWVFLAVFTVLTGPSIAYLWRVNRDIFVARSKIHEGTKAWDKMIVSLLVIAFFTIFPLAALDAARFHWSTVPLWVMVVGYLVMIVGYLGSIWVYATNKFAEPSVRIQTERGQTVVTRGPYKIVRHPLYMWSFFFVLGLPLALGSFWAIIPGLIMSIVLVVRTALEDRTLQAELEGYAEYAKSVRYRLIPGIW
jgi:protein-S-isoprenylcysteine O-methyltransferase Ste14